MLSFLLLFILQTQAASDPQAHLLKAQERLKKRDFEGTTKELNHLMREHKRAPESVQAKIIMADMLYQKQEWDAARIYYQQFLKDHPSHPETDYVSYMIGMTHYKMAPSLPDRDQRRTEEAIRIWSQFLKRYPQSEHREEVEKKMVESRERMAKKELLIAEFYARRQAWESVRRRTEGLLVQYPGSKYTPKALQLNTLAYFLLGDLEIAQQKRDALSKIAPKLIPQLEKRIAKGK